MKGEIEEIKRALDFLTEEVSESRKEIKTVGMQQKMLLEVMEEVKVLKRLIMEKDKKIDHLENRVADLEQYTRINDVIVTGLATIPRSYARAVTGMNREEPDEQDLNTMEKQVTDFLHSKGIKVDRNDIEACHPLPRRNKVDKPAIILRFVNRKHKIALLKQGKKLKGSNVYLNDHLTKRNAEIARKARFLRKERKIQSTWTANCKIYIKLNGTSPEEAKVLVIRHMEDLEEYQ